jgi:hypothetical protein
MRPCQERTTVPLFSIMYHKIDHTLQVHTNDDLYCTEHCTSVLDTF